jgi:acetyl/propionyl-CoA carboxylase alpha subunit
MPFQSRLKHALAILSSLLVISSALAASNQAEKAATLNFGGTAYVHRWSKNGQNEFTPTSDQDLARWHDMVTINVHAAVRNGDQLAEVANSVLSKYQAHGKIVRTDSTPRTQQRPAQHLIVAILGNGAFLEAAFARVMLIDGTGVVAVYSHRVYGKDVADTLGEWLKTSGLSMEKALMTWSQIPSLGALRQLPQSQ